MFCNSKGSLCRKVFAPRLVGFTPNAALFWLGFHQETTVPSDGVRFVSGTAGPLRHATYTMKPEKILRGLF